MTFIPLYINLSGLRVLVVGGGYIGTRRAVFFKEAGARVTVAAKEFREELRRGEFSLIELSLPEDMAKLEELVKTHDLVVVAVSDEELARKVSEMAMKMGKLVNNTVDYKQGNVIVPFRAVVKGIGIAVTSFGASGMAARVALEKAVKVLSEDLEVRTILESFGRFKEQLRKAVRDPKLRMKIYLAIEEDATYCEYVKRGDVIKAYERALEVARSFNVNLEPAHDRFLQEGEQMRD
ncbi:MAG: NAD(P)-dependent oxidoreductase [Acidilobaceae archaeon]